MGAIRKNFLYNAFYQILILLVPLVTTPYISRVLSSNGVGIYSFYYSIAYYFSLFTMLGLANYGNRTIASVRDDKRKLSKAFLSIYTTQVIATIVVSFAYFFYCYLYSNEVISYIFIIYIASSLFDINWFFMGIENFKLFVIRNVLVNLGTVACTFLFVKNSEDLIKYILIIVIGRLIGLISVMPMLKKYISVVKFDFSDVIQHIKPNLILFIPILAVSLYKIMDKIMLGIISVPSEVGFYESSEKVLKIPLALITSLGTVMLPRMSNLVSKHSMDKANRMIEKSLYFAIFLSSSCSFGLMSISQYFVPWFYGNGFLKCISLFHLLMPSCIFLAIGNVIRTQYLIPFKKDAIFLKSVILGAIVNLIINSLLINQYASIGVSIGTLCAEITVCVYQIMYTKNSIDYKMILRNSFPFLVSGIFMYVTVIYIPLNNMSLLIKMGISIIIGVVSYSIYLIVFIKLLKIKFSDYFK